MILDKAETILSVLMTSYNRESLISESIESVLRSSYSDYEFIIVDDASTDSTWQIINEYASRDNRIKAYRNEMNVGDYINRNKAVSYANGKYIKFVDSDDLIGENLLSIMVNQMERYPNVSFGLSADVKWLNMQTNCIWTPLDLFNVYFFHGKAIGTPPSGSILRRNVFNDVGGFSGKKYLGDTELWLKLSLKHNALFFPNNLYYWREHSNQQMKDEQRNPNIKYQRFQMLLDFIENPSLLIPDVFRKMAKRNLKNIHSRLVLLNLIKANISIARQDLRGYDLNPLDLLFSLRPNKYPKNLS
jgi:glycosyltransferase involved in cell wall biosynthesis